MLQALSFLIIAYRRLSQAVLPPTCRFYPSCSAYTLQAIEKYGAIKGIAKGMLRILRCAPWSPGGCDPVR